MKSLYPVIQPYASQRLAVDDLHEVYVEECGSTDGLPVLFVHGGPGMGCEPYHRRFFDPNQYRIVLFDQRGCGRSTPHGELLNNNTPALIDDMEQIRQKLGIEKWLLFGGSWGSTLSLAYAEAYPERVLGLILRGVFLCREKEIDWFYQRGANRIFPDYWQAFLAPIPEGEREEMVAAYHRRLTGNDELARMAAAKAWATWEGRTANFMLNLDMIDHVADPWRALALARIECHFFAHHAFLVPNQLLDHIDRIAHLPGIIIQGRYDMICPMESAWELSQAWPQCDLNVIPDAGHAAAEPGVLSALVDATDSFAKQLK